MAERIEFQTAEDFFERLLAEMSPEDEQYLKQLLAETTPASGPIRGVVQNILEEPIPEEVKERLLRPLRLQSFRPKAPPLRRGKTRLELLKMFDPGHFTQRMMMFYMRGKRG